jgi:hypothetical protein
MTDINTNIPGVRGHTRSTWRDESHLRGLLLKLKNKRPNATRKELEDLFMSAAQADAAMVDEALRYAFDNHFKSLNESVQPQRQPQRKAAPAVSAFVSDDEVVAAKVRFAKIILLDLVMPNGKKLRDCTGNECGEFGGWLLKIKERVGSAIVGDELSEKQLAKIFAANKG